MVIKRKKTTIDGMDREILRTMRNSRRFLNANNISKKVKLTPSAIRPRLDNLEKKGIIKPMKISRIRSFKRPFKTKEGTIEKRVRAPRSITWGIDFKKPRRNITRKQSNITSQNLTKGREIRKANIASKRASKRKSK